MSDAPAKPDAPKQDWRHTVFLPKTDFPMKAGLPQKEPMILAKWQAADLYGQLRAARNGRDKFILHDGPPYANGDIHIGHALNHILKDMVVRTQTLLGKDAPYVPGWDCHGLPIEWKIEEQYRKKKLNKDDVPLPEFRAECRAYAQHWVDTQREQLKRLGIGGQWDKPYLTMNYEAEGTIVGELMKFAESGQLYRGAKPVMWSPVEKTALAEAEIEYEDIVSTQIDVAFEIVESPIPELVGAHAVVWTTTPWTIPVNQAIAYGPNVEYRLIEWKEPNCEPQRSLIAWQLWPQFSERTGAGSMHDLPTDGPECYTRIGSPIMGSELAGTIARHPIYNFLRHSRESGDPAFSESTDEKRDPRFRGDDGEWERALAFYAKPRPFLPGDFVTTDTGTGLVHMSPDHGEDDFALCKAHGIDPVFAVEGNGKYREDWGWLGGQGPVVPYSPKGLDKLNVPEGLICRDLSDAGALLSAGPYPHSYPHSWRSKAKIIYRCTPQWFIAMDRPIEGQFKPRAVARWENEGGAVRIPSPLEGASDEDCPRQSSSDAGDSPQASGVRGCSESLSAADAAGPSPQPSPSRGEGVTLRQLALAAITHTRFVPEKGENRIRSMVEGRPDWVISRQRAWGVPIALFVDRKSGQHLVDTAVNERIVAGIKAGGVDAWSDERAADYLGQEYDFADYERVTDILDVWFDSGCTHAFVLESDTWPEQRWPADLYLEGSDQHRGWFQSSLMESCGTRGRAPYDAVLTHGFTMDAKGLKMSKSVGNTINPLDLMRDYGADILRLWALSVDFTEDHRIGKEILTGVADQYRKLRNTFRYLLGALDGYSEDERVAVDEMPELERYMLSLLAALGERLKVAVNDYDFNDYVRALGDFCNEDLSAFYFDIRKDSLYCDAADDPKRMAYRTVLDTLFHALIRWAAPVLVFTSEEVWGTRYPDAGSVHLLDWPDLPKHDDADAFTNAELVQFNANKEWEILRNLRDTVLKEIEPLRRDKVVGSSLETAVTIQQGALRQSVEELAELFIVASVNFDESPAVTRTTNHKCGRCWRHLPDVTADGALCGRCEGVVNG